MGKEKSQKRRENPSPEACWKHCHQSVFLKTEWETTPEEKCLHITARSVRYWIFSAKTSHRTTLHVPLVFKPESNQEGRHLVTSYPFLEARFTLPESKITHFFPSITESFSKYLFQHQKTEGFVHRSVYSWKYIPPQSHQMKSDPDSTRWYPVKGQEAANKLKYRKFSFSIRGGFFPLFAGRVVNHRHKLLVEDAEPPFLEMFKMQMDTALRRLLWRLDLTSPGGPFPPQQAYNP